MPTVFPLHTGHPVLDSYALEVTVTGAFISRVRWVPTVSESVQQTPLGKTDEILRQSLAESPHRTATTSPATLVAKLTNRPVRPLCQGLEDFASALEEWQNGANDPWRSLLGFLSPPGTRFQEHIREALTQTLRGEIISYSALACRARTPKAIRGVASACANNPVALVVPCHRVVPVKAVADLARFVPQTPASFERRMRQVSPNRSQKIFPEALRLAQESLEAIDFGNYAYGTKLKRALVEFELAWTILETWETPQKA